MPRHKRPEVFRSITVATAKLISDLTGPSTAPLVYATTLTLTLGPKEQQVFGDYVLAMGDLLVRSYQAFYRSVSSMIKPDRAGNLLRLLVEVSELQNARHSSQFHAGVLKGPLSEGHLLIQEDGGLQRFGFKVGEHYATEYYARQMALAAVEGGARLYFDHHYDKATHAYRVTVTVDAFNQLCIDYLFQRYPALKTALGTRLLPASPAQSV